MTKQQERKRIMRSFMQNHYTDERLAMLLAHAQQGKLRYMSCCCFIGITTANHPLQEGISYADGEHFYRLRNNYGYVTAEIAFQKCAPGRSDEERRRILIPMIRAEMRRRDRLASSNTNNKGEREWDYSIKYLSSNAVHGQRDGITPPSARTW
jgi:hypothetical protein